jgi:hypothetical protein
MAVLNLNERPCEIGGEGEVMAVGEAVLVLIYVDSVLIRT